MFLSRDFCGVPSSTMVFKPVKNLSTPPVFFNLESFHKTTNPRQGVLTTLNHVVKANGTSSQQQGLAELNIKEFGVKYILLLLSQSWFRMENGMSPNF